MPSAAVSFREESLQSTGGVRLRVRVATLPEPVRGDVILTHGLGEYCGRYEHVAAAFAEAGLRLWVYDLRGHGLSDGPRGDAAEYRLLVDDLAKVVNRVRQEGRPLFVMGHSLGGQITLSYLLQHGAVGVQGAVITSPWLRLAFTPPIWRIALAKAALLFAPGLCQRTPSNASQLSRDLEHLTSMPNPELCHGIISGRLFFAIEKAGAAALDQAPELRVPVLLIHGDEDAVTCRQSTGLFHERAGSADKQLIIYPEARHETHNDLCRHLVLADICRWIGDRVPTSSA